MRVKRSLWSVLIVAAAFLIVAPEDAFGQKRGRSRSSSSSSRSTSKSKPKPRTKAASPKRGKAGGKASAKKGQFGSSTKKAGKSKKTTKADVKAFEKAKASGKAFDNRKGAMGKFSKDPANTKKYTSSYATKPTTRPGHIPPTYRGSGGTTYNISYNQGYGGYGYMGSLGTWIVYNAMADAAMGSYYDRQMMSAGYHVGPRPIVATGFGMGTIVIAAFALLVIAMVVIPRRGRSGE